MNKMKRFFSLAMAAILIVTPMSVPSVKTEAAVQDKSVLVDSDITWKYLDDERFHSMPIARSTVLWGHVLTSIISNGISVIVIILVALLMGFRSSAGIIVWLMVFGILGIFTLALTWIAVIAGLAAKTPDGAGAFSFFCHLLVQLLCQQKLCRQLYVFLQKISQ